jgi:hypothetical protein
MRPNLRLEPSIRRRRLRIWEDIETAVGESLTLFCRSRLGLHELISSFFGRTNELETEKDIQSEKIANVFARR